MVIILMATNVTQKNVIDYCGTWYGSTCGSLMAMFVDPKHILCGLNAKDDGAEVSNIGLIKTMGKGVHLMNEVGAFDE
jgi:hypothetical protein